MIDIVTKLRARIEELEGALRPSGEIDWQPMTSAKRENAKNVLLWHNRANVGAWWDSWPYDGRHPEAETEGAWVINGGYVVSPSHWAPINHPECLEASETL